MLLQDFCLLILAHKRHLWKLAQNRSTNSILELASCVLDLITHFFPEKLDKLPKETSRVMLVSKLLPELGLWFQDFQAEGFQSEIYSIIFIALKLIRTIITMRPTWWTSGRVAHHRWFWIACCAAAFLEATDQVGQCESLRSWEEAQEIIFARESNEMPEPHWFWWFLLLGVELNWRTPKTTIFLRFTMIMVELTCF